MDKAVQLNPTWLRENPLPPLPCDLDKNSRGRVLIIGGSTTVPGGIRLTAEAAFRAGAGKVQLAVPERISLGLGLLIPEAGIISISDRLGTNEDLFGAVKDADCVVIGPAMAESSDAEELLAAAIDNLSPAATLLVDAIAIGCIPEMQSKLPKVADRMVLTPNPGEMASLLDKDLESIQSNPADSLRIAVDRYETTIAFKGTQTRIRAPSGVELAYAGGGPGLATGGSGDVLAGIIGGLLSRQDDALCASGWGVWLHGEAGAMLRHQVGELGFLAREIAPLVPSLLDRIQRRASDSL